jgi:hypothetical protein
MTMDKRMWACAAVLSVALGILATPARAAPVLGTDAAGMKATLAETSTVEKARWVRRCGCRRVWIGPSFYGPRVGFFFGPRVRHFRGGRHFGVRHFRGGRHFGARHFRGGRGFRGAAFHGGRGFRGPAFHGGRGFRGGGRGFGGGGRGR